MRTVENVTIKNAILHWARPRSGSSAPELSDLELDVASTHSDVIDFLTSHLKQGLVDPSAHTAKFRGQIAGGISDWAGQLINKPSTFADRSRDLVTALFQIAAADRRIKDGTIAVIRYTADLEGVTRAMRR